MILARWCLLSLLIACPALPQTACANESESGPTSSEEPLFTGTLLSTRGSTLDEGHAVIMPYFYSTEFGGLYNNSWRLQSATTTRTNVVQTYLIYGLTNRIDVEIDPQWVGNHAENESTVGFGDLPLQIGFQALRPPADSWAPDVRIWVQETFPTGTYTGLSPTKAGLVGTGGGSFVTTLGIGAQKLFSVIDDHVFRARVNATHGFYSAVNVQGFNSYGGGFGTAGRVEPGSVTTLILGGEYTLTHHVTLALDVSAQFVNATRFSGTAGVGINGEPATTGKGYNEVFSVAPAVEYNWNQHVGIIAGPWFSVLGRNTQAFFGFAAGIFLYL
jgi:hypothetical protein